MLMVLPLLTVGVISYRYYSNAAWENSLYVLTKTIGDLSGYIEGVFAEAEKFLEIDSFTVTEDYLAGRGDQYENAKSILAMMNLFMGRRLQTNQVLDIYLIGINGIGISEREGVFALRNQFEIIPSLKDLEYGSDKTVVIQFNRSDFSGYWNKPKWQSAAIRDYRLSLGVGRYVRDAIRKNVLGVAIVEVDPRHIDQSCREQGEAGDVVFSIYDQDGRKLFGDNSGIDPKHWDDIVEDMKLNEFGYFVRDSEGIERFFVYKTSKTTGLRIVGYTPMDVIMYKAYRIRSITIASVFVSVVCTMLLYWFISDRLTKPIKILQERMNIAAGGNLNVRFQSINRDEIAVLGDSFNSMIERIRNLIQQQQQEHENLKKAEFRALQSQINPHFLYNTLDSILWMAQASRRVELTEMVIALSRFFRLTLNKGRDVVTVEEEVEHAKNYLIIQHMRYPDIVQYEISVRPEILRMRMIKLTLQPLIENAIYHGLKKRRGGGTVWIEGILDKDDSVIVFQIRDNGTGMTEERLRQVTSEFDHVHEKQDEGYALLNVHERIQLSYGSEYGLSIESVENEGTTVTMVFPSLETQYV
jgi:two-component system sensor histidine kinase YesM